MTCTHRQFYKGKKSIEEIRAWQSSRDYPGNAPPMRALPLGASSSPLLSNSAWPHALAFATGFLPEDYMEFISRANANATHPHPKCKISRTNDRVSVDLHCACR